MLANNYTLIDSAEAKQYEFHIDSLIPKVEYIKTQNKIFLTHTEVPIQIEGKGVGTSLVKQVLEDVEKQGLTLVPMCPFVALFVKRHPEWKKLVFNETLVR